MIGGMAWKWYDVTSYKVAVGSQTGASDYGSVQLMGGPQFYALLKFLKSGALPAATAPFEFGQQRFYGYLDFQQMSVMVDMLRNESPVRFGYIDTNPQTFKVMTGTDEPIGEGE